MMKAMYSCLPLHEAVVVGLSDVTFVLKLPAAHVEVIACKANKLVATHEFTDHVILALVAVTLALVDDNADHLVAVVVVNDYKVGQLLDDVAVNVVGTRLEDPAAEPRGACLLPQGGWSESMGEAMSRSCAAARGHRAALNIRVHETICQIVISLSSKRCIIK